MQLGAKGVANMNGFDAAAEARKLVRQSRYGTLATLEPDGSPYASLVSLATLMDGTPVTLISALAKHTANLTRDGRASLMLSRIGPGDPLVSARISIAVRVEEGVDPAVRRRFLARNPDAALYAGFPDFSFRRLVPTGAHLVAGFGRIVDLQPVDLLSALDGAEALEEAEVGAIFHMNDDHADALELYATRLLGLAPGEWRATGIDPDGLDMRLGDDTARLLFPSRVQDGQQLVAALRILATQARAV